MVYIAVNFLLRFLLLCPLNFVLFCFHFCLFQGIFWFLVWFQHFFLVTCCSVSMSFCSFSVFHSSFIPLWSEKMLETVSVLLNLLGLILWPIMLSVLENIFMHTWEECVCIYMYVCILVYVCISVYVYMYVCIYIYVCLYISVMSCRY